MLTHIFAKTDNWIATVQLFISLFALTTIVWLFLKYYVERKKATMQIGNHEIATTVTSRWIHTLYIGGIATFIILEFIVYVVLNNDKMDDIINTVSFGATLSSLIMSVVAIIFTIVHGRNGETQLGQITQATDQLRTSASALVKFKDIADDIDTHIDTFQTQISGRIDSLSSSLNDKISLINTILKEVRDRTAELKAHQDNVQNQTKTSPTATLPKDFSIDNYLMAGSYTGAVSLLACCYAHKTNKRINFSEIANAFMGSSLDYVYGYIISSGAVGVINMDGDFPDFSVSVIIDGLEDACIKMIKTFLPSIPSESLDEYFSNLNIITSYFGIPSIVKEYFLKS